MMPFLHSRSTCDACRSAAATIERSGIWLCASCDSSITEFSVAPDPVLHPGVNAAAAPPPAPVAAAASNSDPMRDHSSFPPCVSADCGGASASSFFSFGDPGMAGFDIDFEYEVAILEAQWLRDGIIMNARTFFTEAVNSICPDSNSSA